MGEEEEEHGGKRRNPYITRIEDLIDENAMTVRLPSLILSNKANYEVQA